MNIPPTDRRECDYCHGHGIHNTPTCPGIDIDLMLYGDMWALAPKPPTEPPA
jgi:hypothetical protein